MTTASYEISELDIKNASPAEYDQLNTIRNSLRREANPEDPETPVEQTTAELQNVPPIYTLRLWVARDAEGRIVATSNVGIPHMETNQHIAQFDIEVLPEHRRNHLATRFLEDIVRVSKEEERSLLLAGTKSTVPSGERFMTSLGASVGLAMHTNELQIADVDRGTLRRWQESARDRARDFEIGLWEGAYPQDQLEAVAQMKQAMNTMPKDDLDVEDFQWTADQLRQMDEALEKSGDRRWVMYARETSTGKLAGFTDMYWNPGRPTIGMQGDTGVFEEFKNRGLGRWLKAAMLEKLMNERPQVTLVRTGNAQSNAPMLKINNELGFKPSMAQVLWQVKREDLEHWLTSRSARTV